MVYSYQHNIWFVHSLVKLCSVTGSGLPHYSGQATSSTGTFVAKPLYIMCWWFLRHISETFKYNEYRTIWNSGIKLHRPLHALRRQNLRMSGLHKTRSFPGLVLERSSDLPCGPCSLIRDQPCSYPSHSNIDYPINLNHKQGLPLYAACIRNTDITSRLFSWVKSRYCAGPRAHCHFSARFPHHLKIFTYACLRNHETAKTSRIKATQFC